MRSRRLFSAAHRAFARVTAFDVAATVAVTCAMTTLASNAFAGGGDQDDSNTNGSEFEAPLTRHVETGSSPSFIQYGVAFDAVAVPNAGPMCRGATNNCILGSGGGIVVPRIGWRSDGKWYIGGAYEFTKQDASNLYRLGILQQLRAEGRYYFLPAYGTQPFVGINAGVAAYGNSWSIDTYGPEAGVSIGIETEISRRSSMGAEVGYRFADFTRFDDSGGGSHAGGIAHFVGLSLLLEVRDAI